MFRILKGSTHIAHKINLLGVVSFVRFYYNTKKSKEGYFIYLKDDYINDVTNNRSIYCKKTAELRRIIVYTHKKY